MIETPCEEPNMDGAVECQERLGGVLKYYRRAGSMTAGQLLAQDAEILQLGGGPRHLRAADRP